MADTPRYGLTTPDDPDSVDIPVDMALLATQIEALLKAGHVDFFSAGDFKTSARSADHGRWLLCDGRSLTQAEIEAAVPGVGAGGAATLVGILGVGNASIYGNADAGDEVKLPDARSRFPVFAGAGGGGLSARPLKGAGSTGGAETVTLTGAQSGVNGHTHSDGSLAAASHQHEAGTLVTASHLHADGTLAAAGHTHSDGTLSAANHSHSAGTLYAADHSHGIFFNTGTPGSNINYRAADAARTILLPTDTHVHLVSGNTGGSGNLGVGGDTANSGALDVAGATGSAGADVTGNTAMSGAVDVSGDVAASGALDVSGSTGNVSGAAAGGESGADEAHENMPPFVTVGSLFIRV